MRFKRVEPQLPKGTAAYEVYGKDGVLLGRVEQSETSVDDWRRGKIYGQKRAVRWFAAPPGERARLGMEQRKYRTRQLAAESLIASCVK